jgi:hypothetical protein
MTGQPAGNLRRAATLMRERATAASPGPWHQLCLGSEGCQVLNDGHLRDRKHVSFSGRKEWKADHADAEYIAGVDPGVALAAADWLETEARMCDVRGNSPEGHTFHALAVARAFLGEVPA